MTPEEFRSYLYQQIPLARALEVQVVQLGPEQVELKAPLGPNSNHMGTAFGGSLGALLILGCYAWLFNRMSELGEHCHVVVHSAHTDYLKPVTGDILIRCERKADEAWKKSLELFQRRGIARLNLESQVVSPSGEVLCRLEGEFVAKKI